jgi:hypothetical protein
MKKCDKCKKREGITWTRIGYLLMNVCKKCCLGEFKMKIKKGKYYVVRVKKGYFPEILPRDKTVVQVYSIGSDGFVGRLLCNCKFGWGKNKNHWWMHKENVIREATNDEIIWESLK